MLQHVTDPDGALAELVRVLRSGGLAVFAEPDQATLTIDGCDPDLTPAIVQYSAMSIVEKRASTAARPVACWRSQASACRFSWTMTATIAAELAEVVFGGDHYRILFLLGTLLFAVTFITNLIGDLVVHRLKERR